MKPGYRIDYNVEKELVILRVEGKINFKLAEKYSLETKKAGAEKKCNKFLFDHTETKAESSGNYKLYTDGAALEKFGFINKDKVAIIVPRETEGLITFKKIENNARWCSFKYFNNAEEGLQWLKGLYVLKNLN